MAGPRRERPPRRAGCRCLRPAVPTARSGRPGWRLAAATAIGSSQPGPGRWCAQSTRSTRRSSAICRHQRNAPPTNPMTTPATIAVDADVRTEPRIDSSGWTGSCRLRRHKATNFTGQIPPRGIVKRMTEVDHSQHQSDTDHAEQRSGHGGHHDHVAQFRRLFWIMAGAGRPDGGVFGHVRDDPRLLPCRSSPGLAGCRRCSGP